MIELRGLSRRFGALEAVRDVTLSVRKGEVFGFLGPNGSGKSTTTKMLCTLLRPTAGEASVAGASVTDDPVRVRAAIGYVPEKVPVYATMTAREYLRAFARLHGVPRDAREPLVERLLARVGLAGVEGRRVGGFSKGMVQRLGLARALVNDPQVLFLDEPASGLDPVARREIRELMVGLAAEGKTVWLTSHDMNEVQAVCHRIAFIRQGRLTRVAGVGERAEARAAEFEFEGPDAAVRDRLAAEPSVARVEALAPGRVRVTYGAGTDRRALARALHAAGGVLLEARDAAPSVEDMYLRYAHGAGDAEEATP
ncbi:MAG TPA: ABC transporter ATP-binding protein [Candidatus Thermoplasmatota archaeon]|nr:ABC transporter ATP-binding protein [Candidatus Thermoplasmatota archaeon]